MSLTMLFLMSGSEPQHRVSAAAIDTRPKGNLRCSIAVCWSNMNGMRPALGRIIIKTPGIAGDLESDEEIFGVRLRTGVRAVVDL